MFHEVLVPRRSLWLTLQSWNGILILTGGKTYLRIRYQATGINWSSQSICLCSCIVLWQLELRVITLPTSLFSWCRRCLHIFICFPGILHLEIFHCSSWILSILINGLCSLSLWTGEMQFFYVRISYSLWWASTHVLLLFLHMRFLFVIRVCSLALGMQSCCIAHVYICSHVKYASLRCFSSMTDTLANSCKLWIGWLL